MWLTDLGPVYSLAVAITSHHASMDPFSIFTQSTGSVSIRPSTWHLWSILCPSMCFSLGSIYCWRCGWEGRGSTVCSHEREVASRKKYRLMHQHQPQDEVLWNIFLPTQFCVSSRPCSPAKLITLCTACKWFEIVNDMFLNNHECFHEYIFKIFHRWFGG